MRDEKRYLQSTIHMLEDKLLRTNDPYEQEKLLVDLRKLRKKLQKIEWEEWGRT